MLLQIFDVEHGACALLTCDNGERLMLDCGHNASTGWRPGTYLRSKNITKLEMLAITNYDEDHASGIANLCDQVDVRWLSRNKSVSSNTLKSLKSEDGMGAGIERLIYEIDHTFTGDGTAPLPSFAGLERTVFYNSYPTFEDENNLSYVNFLNCNGIGVLFPGDLEKAGWLKLLEREDFRNVLRRTNVLIAPHHGRDSGCCDALKAYCNPHYVVISDKGYMYDTQKTIPFYRSIAKGGPFRGETRQVLTTRCDGMITFEFHPGKWLVY